MGALFGGLVIQCLVLNFNISFCLQGVVKVVPIMCVIRGLLGFTLFMVFNNQSQFNVNHLDNKEEVNSREFIISKIWFLPFLRRDLYSYKVLEGGGLIKRRVEDGYIESFIGGEGI